MSEWYPVHIAIGGRISRGIVQKIVEELAADNLTIEDSTGFRNKPVYPLAFQEAAEKCECLKVGKDSAYYGKAPNLEQVLTTLGVDFTRITDNFNTNNKPSDLVSKDILLVHIAGKTQDYYADLRNRLYLDTHEVAALKAQGMSDEDIQKMLQEVPWLPGPVVLE